MNVLLLHALPLDERMWEPQLPALAANPTLVARLTGADPSRIRSAARTATSPADLPPARELIREIAAAMNLEARIER